MDVLFQGRPFSVAPGLVMMPREATEALVDAAAARLGERAARVADVGTGTGVIAVTLALLAPLVEVWATDTNEHATRLAQENAERHGVADRVHVVLGDLLDPVPRGLDLVVANLPYLPDSLRDPRYEDEPPEAIYAPEDGLVPYRRLLAAAKEHLTTDGALVIQFHRKALVADRAELDALRSYLDRRGA
jgi:release factor glutamine methyltransferase